MRFRIDHPYATSSPYIQDSAEVSSPIISSHRETTQLEFATMDLPLPSIPNPSGSTRTERPRLYLLDYGAGNVRSLANSIHKLGYDFEWIQTVEDFDKAEVSFLTRILGGRVASKAHPA